MTNINDWIYFQIRRFVNSSKSLLFDEHNKNEFIHIENILQKDWNFTKVFLFILRIGFNLSRFRMKKKTYFFPHTHTFCRHQKYSKYTTIYQRITILSWVVHIQHTVHAWSMQLLRILSVVLFGELLMENLYTIN